MEIPENCHSNETLMQIIEEMGLFDNSTAAVEIPIHNYSDPNFNVSLCYDKLDENQTHTFLHYETGLGGYANCIVGFFGLIGNMVSIAVLSRKELRKSCFNQLLIALLISDNLHIVFGILEAYRLSFAAYYPNFMLRIFPYFQFPFYRITLVSSIYVMIAVATERFLAVCFPHSYHNMSAAHNYRFLYYVLPAIAGAFVIGAPRFFETHYTYRVTMSDNCTLHEFHEVTPTPMRFHPTYIITYINWVWTMSTAIVPFVTLVILNAKIFLGLRRVQKNLKRHKTLSSESKKSRPAAFLASKCGLSKGEGNPPEETIPLNELRDNNENEANGATSPNRSPVDEDDKSGLRRKSTTTAPKDEKRRRTTSVSTAAQSREANMAVILVCSVTMFILCHLPRIFVTIYEAATADIILNCNYRRKRAIPVWFLYIPPIVKFLQVFNASINFPIYYTMGTAFRKSFHALIGVGKNQHAAN